MAYHPIIFKPLKRINMIDRVGETIGKCLMNSISVYCPHTSLDACDGGINDWLVDGIVEGEELLNKRPILVLPQHREYPNSGMGRFIKFKQAITFESLVQRVKKHLSLKSLRIAIPQNKHLNSPIASAAICAGSGFSILNKVEEDEGDNTSMAYFTGEMSHHEILEALSRGIFVILGEHSNTERGFLSKHLQPKLQNMLEETQVFCSSSDKDPILII
jgi:dinuclear metal center YbgI/SA1388 family protein